MVRRGGERVQRGAREDERGSHDITRGAVASARRARHGANVGHAAVGPSAKAPTRTAAPLSRMQDFNEVRQTYVYIRHNRHAILESKGLKGLKETIPTNAWQLSVKEVVN